MNTLRHVHDEAYELRAQVCKSLSSPVRLKVLDLLRNGERSVKDLVSATQVSQPNLSIHLKFLWENGVVARRQEGTTVYYRVAQPEIYDVIDIFRKINTKKLARQHRLSRRRTPR
jgi:DNA-binding transcriptional ArsR family regulator